eukprot:SAG31_NODE_2542_length_5534_cov_31.055934_3_plen_60_part_00
MVKRKAGTVTTVAWTHAHRAALRSARQMYILSISGLLVRSYFLVFVPTIRESRDFYREM